MNQLKLTSHATGQSEVAVFHLDGSLDATTVNQWAAFLQDLPNPRWKVLVLNCSRLSKITSFGLGLLAGFLQSFSGGNARVVFCHVSEKIRPLLKMIKLPGTAVSVLDSEVEALEFARTQVSVGSSGFKLILPETKVVSGVPFHLRVEAVNEQRRVDTSFRSAVHLITDRGIISPALLLEFNQGIWEGDVIISGSGQVQLRAWVGERAGAAGVQVVEEGTPIRFPVAINCPGCQKENIASKADVSRCLDCNQIYYVDAYGHVIPLKTGSKREDGYLKHLAFKFPSDVNYLSQIRNFIVGVAREEKIEEEKISQIEMSLDEALANVIEHAYAYDAHQEIDVEVSFFHDRVELVIADHGRSFDHHGTPLPDLKKHIEERRVGGLGRYLILTLMDEVEYQSHGNYNRLRMVKHYQSRSRE